jgi:hypothetical protein
MKENVLAQGSVALWVMIEDSCSILRQVTCTSAYSKTYLLLVFHLKSHYCSRVNSRLLSYAMIKISDVISIASQEVDILDCVNNKVIGFAVVDVRGHRLLKECS